MKLTSEPGRAPGGEVNGNLTPLIDVNVQFLVIARVLWGFDLTTPTNKNGQKIEQNILKMVDGFMSTPENFKAIVTPRSAKRAKIFRDEWAGSRYTSLRPNL